MLKKIYSQSFNWLSNKENLNPVVNEASSLKVYWWGIKMYEKNIDISHEGEYDMTEAAKVKTVKGFSK